MKSWLVALLFVCGCSAEPPECRDVDCDNGSCILTIEGPECSCFAGFSGDNCDVAGCDGDPCANGICEETSRNFTCDCQPGWTGPLCDEPIDECAVDPCVNGQCIDGDAVAICDCEDGWEGDRCQINTDDCADDPCVNGACVDQRDAYECACHPGFEGDQCEEPIDECATAECTNGTCVDEVAGFSCVCDAGWRGADCSEPVDFCASDPCDRGACNNSGIGFECACDAGWEGETCADNVDECASQPCANGRCVDGDNAFECVCDSGWEGVDCAVNVDECANSLCVNGECVDGIDGYTCDCEPDYTGRFCVFEVDACEDFPCARGECIDGVGTFTCDCPIGWAGPTCDEFITGPCSPGFTGDDCGVQTAFVDLNRDVDGDGLTWLTAFNTIQQGLDAPGERLFVRGDVAVVDDAFTVRVTEDHEVWGGFSLALVGTQGEPDARDLAERSVITVAGPSFSRTVVTLLDRTQLDGFSFRLANGLHHGSALRVWGDDVRVGHVDIEGFRLGISSWESGNNALECYGLDVHLHDIQVSGNARTDWYPSAGGASLTGCSGVLERAVFRNNSAVGSPDGSRCGGLSVNTLLSLSDVQIVRNGACANYLGVMPWLLPTWVTVEGGGVCVYGTGTAMWNNVTVADNGLLVEARTEEERAFRNTMTGAAVYVAESASVLATNTQITGNRVRNPQPNYNIGPAIVGDFRFTDYEPGDLADNDPVSMDPCPEGWSGDDCDEPILP